MSGIGLLANLSLRWQRNEGWSIRLMLGERLIFDRFPALLGHSIWKKISGWSDIESIVRNFHEKTQMSSQPTVTSTNDDFVGTYWRFEFITFSRFNEVVVKKSSNSLPLLSVVALFHKGLRPFISAAITMFFVTADGSDLKGSKKDSNLGEEGRA